MNFAREDLFWMHYLIRMIHSIQSNLHNKWKALENKYITEKRIDFLVWIFRVLNNRWLSVMDQVDELLVLISRPKALKEGISEQLQVTVVIAKLSITWNDYKKKLLQFLKILQ